MLKFDLRYLLYILLIVSLFSCKKDELLTDPNAKLDFSEDSILFDTVFTTIGSTTKHFKIYNNNNQPINISSLKIARGSASNFRINVDGVPGVSFSNIEIPRKDSLFVFVEVTVDPNDVNSPMMILDSIIFETNGNMQDVDLVAVGQDVWLHTPDTIIQGLPPFSIIPCNDVWVNDKPHLIYGYTVVDSACSLTIQAGVRVYLHNGGGLWIYRGGNLKVLGTVAQPVTFQGDRLEQEYQDIPGQWDRIWINEGSVDNVIDHAIIKNGFIGIQTETILGRWTSTGSTLKLTNTKIHNMSGMGIFTRYYNIVAGNNLITNCGQYNLAITLGGSYSFRHCTFANYWVHSQRSTPAVYINNYNSAQAIDLDSAYFGNCIIYGDKANEVQLDSIGGKAFNFKFQNTLIRIDPSVNTSSSFHYNSIIKNQDPGFADAYGGNFKLSAGSVARDQGNPIDAAKFPKDIIEKDRPNPDTGKPDLGCYEFY